jgi:hypothetical protein
MPTTATKPKPKAETAAQSLARLNQQLRNQSIADWQRWAVQIADGGSPPDGRELLAAASALGIDDPAAALEDDSAAIFEARAAARNEAACEAVYAEMIAPFGGDPDKILAAIEAARAEVERLQAVYRNAIDQCGASYYRSRVHNVRVNHTRIWPDYANTGKAEEL